MSESTDNSASQTESTQLAQFSRSYTSTPVFVPMDCSIFAATNGDRLQLLEYPVLSHFTMMLAIPQMRSEPSQ
jgi:hypothetical protein